MWLEFKDILMEEINKIVEEVALFSLLHLPNLDRSVTPKKEDLAKIAIHRLLNKLLEIKISNLFKPAKNNS